MARKIAKGIRSDGRRAVWFEDSLGNSHCLPIEPSTKSEHDKHASWTLTGSAESPTLSPSIKSWYPAGNDRAAYCNHFHIRDGVIEYCADCTHEHNAQKHPLPDTDINDGFDFRQSPNITRSRDSK